MGIIKDIGRELGRTAIPPRIHKGFQAVGRFNLAKQRASRKLFGTGNLDLLNKTQSKSLKKYIKENYRPRK